MNIAIIITPRSCREYMDAYAKGLAKKNIDFRVNYGRRIISTKDGDNIVFMTSHELDIWCKGRTYLMNGERYHSGYPFKRKIGE